jgi:alkanesulfonate monooxygenase SsuD/methylene tetrahydromethanopterin reductase-like flavin-dependent oxidoreductase (luciferase family)
VRAGLFLPNFGPGFGDAAALAELALDAESAGWDGFFLWDHVARELEVPLVDPWVALAAVAVATERIRIGALVTPLPRRRPWQVARQTASLDHLSGGRLVFGAGIGSGRPSEWGDLGEVTDPRVRGARLDEGLAVLTGLWSGAPFSFAGDHHTVENAHFLPPPVQRPRIPVWIAAYWPHRRPLRRAARWDGLFPLFRGFPAAEEPRLLAEAVAFVKAERAALGGADAPFDVVYCAPARGEAERARGAEALAPIREAGATWWLERLVPEDFGGDWDRGWPAAAIREHVLAGPPDL